MYLGVLPACMHVYHMIARYLQRPEDMGFPDTGATDSYQTSCGCWVFTQGFHLWAISLDPRFLFCFWERISWLSWNLLCRASWPLTQKSACLCLPSTGIRGVYHHPWFKETFSTAFKKQDRDKQTNKQDRLEELHCSICQPACPAGVHGNWYGSCSFSWAPGLLTGVEPLSLHLSLFILVHFPDLRPQPRALALGWVSLNVAGQMPPACQV